MTRRLLVLVSVVGLVVGPACSSGGDDDSFRLVLDGRAEVDGDDGARTLDAGEHDVTVGDTVRVVDGSATLELPGDREVLLRAGRDGAEDSEVRVADEPSVIGGEAVVVAADDTTIDADGIEVSMAAGAVRVQTGLATTVGLYAGEAEVASAGRSLDGGLRALRQVTVAGAGLLPREPSPLVYDAAEPDPWDRRFLGEAIDLGQALERRSRGFTGQLGPDASVDAALLRTALPPLVDADGFDEALVEDDRSPGETLVGAAIVVEAGGAVDETWSEVFDFRGDGATWGLVALDQAVERDPLLGLLDGAFGRAPLLFAAGPGDGGGGAGGGATSTTTIPDGGVGGEEPGPPTTEPPDGGGDDPPITVPPITVPPVEPDEPDDPGGDDPGVVGEVVEEVDEVVGDILDDDPAQDGLDEVVGDAVSGLL